MMETGAISKSAWAKRTWSSGISYPQFAPQWIDTITTSPGRVACLTCSATRWALAFERSEDAGRRKKACIPREISFKTKPQIALEQIREALAAGIPQGTVLVDASYGSNSEFRIGVSALEIG